MRLSFSYGGPFLLATPIALDDDFVLLARHLRQRGPGGALQLLEILLRYVGLEDFALIAAMVTRQHLQLREQLALGPVLLLAKRCERRLLYLLHDKL